MNTAPPTHKVIKKLEDAGASPPLAKAVVEASQALSSDLATKADLEKQNVRLESRIDLLDQKMAANHESLKQEMAANHASLRQEMAANHASLRQEMKTNNAELKSALLWQMLLVVGVFNSLLLVSIAVLSFFQAN